MSTEMIVTHDPQTLDAQADAQRARLESSLKAVGQRLQDNKATVDAYVDRVHDIEDGVRRFRWPVVGAAMFVGALIGYRRTPPRPTVYLLPATTDAEPPPPRSSHGLLKSALGAVARHLARRAIERWLG